MSIAIVASPRVVIRQFFPIRFFISSSA